MRRAVLLRETDHGEDRKRIRSKRKSMIKIVFR